mgnify:CR=1 FL=1
MQNYLPACKIVSTHGVRGEMKALPLCDGAAFLAKFKRLFSTAEGAGETRVLGVRAQGNVILLRLDGITDMDAARAQVGRVYYLAKADARLPKGRYFIDDLLDCEVVDAETGKVYGTLTDVDHPAAQDIYTVKAPNGKEYMFPGVDAFLKERNPPEGYLLVTPIPGLLDDDVDSEREET